MAWIGNWPGGRIWQAKSGKLTYWINKRVNGKRYVVKTPASKVNVAMAHLARFESDPEGYDPSGALPGHKLVLDAKMVERFRHWQDEVKKNDPDYVQKLHRQLQWWQAQLVGRDLRRLDLRRDILSSLEGSTDRAAATKALKGLYSWLRKVEFLIKRAEDPTLDTLVIPSSKPAQWRKSKVIAQQDHAAVLAQLGGTYRDILVVLAGTGWHVTEVLRLAHGGRVEQLPVTTLAQHGTSHVLLCPKRKSGEPQRTAVTEAVADSAQRLIDNGGFSRIRFYQKLKEACGRAGVEPYGAGQYRHSVATWAISQGTDPAAVSAFLGHRSPATTKRFYATHAVVPAVPTYS